MKRVALFMAMGIFGTALSLAAPVHAALITQLDLTGGAVNYDGKYSRMMDRLLGQEGTLELGRFQAIGDIVPSIDKASRTYSIFTSGFSGAAAPSATISGSSISVDLSSLFFGVSWGDVHKTWNIGDLATGLFNPDTNEFMLSWDRLFDGGKKGEKQATFFLRGVAHTDVQPIPLPAGLVLYATGLFGLGSLTWWRRRSSLPAAS
jgi:hypothetical protein